MNNLRKCWSELFEIWLESIGATLVEIDHMWRSQYGKFTYNNKYYKWSFYNTGPLQIDIGCGRGWADIDLNTENIDIRDPSFNPDAFFDPFKKWLLEDALEDALKGELA